MIKLKQIDRPYIISYIRDERRLNDSAATLDEAKARIGRRLAKRHNRGERAEVYMLGKMIWATGFSANAETH